MYKVWTKLVLWNNLENRFRKQFREMDEKGQEKKINRESTIV